MSSPRPKRGVLHILPSLPLDILCEIFSCLLPADLLVLARTSRSFRLFLLNSSTAFIWRSARRNLPNLPEPPSDMSEVQYASLVFGFACHYEGCDRKARDIVWHLRIRSCANCRPKHQPVKVNDCPDYLAVCSMLACYPSSLEQYMPCGPFLNSKGKPIKGFQEHHVKAFADELRALPFPQRQAYLDRRRQATQLITQFASAGVAWQLDAKSVRIKELHNKRAARAEIIHEALVASGFKVEIDYFGWDRIRKHPLITSTQAITDKSRSGVLDQLREHILDWRELRMEEQVYAFRRRVFVDAWLQFTIAAFRNAPRGCPYLPLPPNAVIGFSESIDSIIRRPNEMSHDYFLQQLYATFPLACEYIPEWHRTIRRELASSLPGYGAEDGDEAILAQLKLATSIFRCNASHNCRGAQGRILTYPEILFHPCFTSMTSGNGLSPKDPRGIANQKAFLTMDSGPWNCSDRVRVHPGQYVVNKLLLCCGKDPRSTTATEMDKLDLGLTCAECTTTRDREIILMTWRRAVQHTILFHPDSTLERPWFMASRSHMRTDMSGIAYLRSFSSVSDDTLGDYSVCLLCPPRIPSWITRFGFGDLIGHIKNMHGVPNPTFGKDYSFDTNIAPIYFDLVVTT